MPPPARGCLRSEGLVPGGQAGVAGVFVKIAVHQFLEDDALFSWRSNDFRIAAIEKAHLKKPGLIQKVGIIDQFLFVRI